MKRNSAALLFVCALVPLVNSFADTPEVCVAKTCFQSQSGFSPSPLPIRGAALFRYWSFHVYTAALYAPDGVTSRKELLGDVPKVLVLHYHRKLTRENIVENSEIILKRNPDIRLESIRPELERLYALYRDVEPGDRYALSYTPGRGTVLYLNGAEQGVFKGKEFAHAYFGIWLSDYSVKDEFTKKLFQET